MDGRSLSVTFSLLRENSLYWNYYINNYLKGNSPIDFDLLYWNGDSTNVAVACHSTLLRQFYLENRLIDPKGYKINGVYIDLSKIKIPTYFISTQEDHIALWQGTYRGAKTEREIYIRIGRIRPYCRYRESSCEKQIWFLDKR
ncbi:polyhydroxyalkanoic acid synthase [Photobacterium aphoticum]|uniref:Polyhydroxyalkanoic acid synthase n=1 Tax=Photobacterium aphoticum TaxID=754436 RepID=A0A090QIG4_9GAMM|nr:polyhydroxyalkanoic acid synthase [Photobacterium aphoticum]